MIFDHKLVNHLLYFAYFVSLVCPGNYRVAQSTAFTAVSSSHAMWLVQAATEKYAYAHASRIEEIIQDNLFFITVLLLW